MASIRDHAYAGAVPVPPDYVKLVELHGTAQHLLVMAGWLGATGYGSVGNPMVVPLHELVSLLSNAIVLANDGGGPTFLARGINADVLNVVWNALQDVGSGDAPDVLKYDVPYVVRGSLEKELSRRRDILAASPRRGEITLDVATMPLRPNDAAGGDVPGFMINGLAFERGSIGHDESGDLSMYSFLVYFAPDIYNQAGLRDAASTSVTALRRLGSAFARWVNERTGDPGMTATMTDGELGVSLRDYVSRLAMPPAIRGHAPPGPARLAQLTAMLMRIQSIERCEITHLQD